MKRLDRVTREAIKRFLSHKYSPNLLRMINYVKNHRDNKITIDELKKLSQEKSEITEKVNVSSVLVMNKIDLCTSKRRLRALQEELEDVGNFDKTFHVSTLTGILIH